MDVKYSRYVRSLTDALIAEQDAPLPSNFLISSYHQYLGEFLTNSLGTCTDLYQLDAIHGHCVRSLANMLITE